MCYAPNVFSLPPLPLSIKKLDSTQHFTFWKLSSYPQVPTMELVLTSIGTVVYVVAILCDVLE